MNGTLLFLYFYTLLQLDDASQKVKIGQDIFSIHALTHNKQKVQQNHAALVQFSQGFIAFQLEKNQMKCLIKSKLHLQYVYCIYSIKPNLL